MARQGATAFAYAQIELWAFDKHRIGLNPLPHKRWNCDGQCPLERCIILRARPKLIRSTPLFHW